ncbi:hypothetical protein FB451DRAFT_1230668, partial [Mycena latifolia]
MAYQLSIADSLSYLDAVKAEVPSATYDEFRNLLQQFRIGSLPTADLLESISDLFSGRPTLIAGMNAFVSAGFGIACTEDREDRHHHHPRGRDDADVFL